MDSQLCQALRSLCFNTGWNYAIFWKLNYQAPMVLTVEDAYYENHERHGPSEIKSSEKAGWSCGGQFSNNSLGLALAKMSSHVYSLGEGVVGQVATTGKHLWISSDKDAMDVCSLLKYYDGWLTQFSAGIKTIAVVAVVPHGVVQLGSLNSISEELKLVNHIRDTIFELQENIAGYISSTDCSSCLFNVSCRSSVSRNFHKRIRIPDENIKNEETNTPSSVFLSPDELYSAVPLLEGYAKKTSVIDKNQELEKSNSGVCESLDLLESSFMERQQQLNANFASRKGESSSGFRDSVVGSENNDDLSSLNMFSGDKSNFYDVTRGAKYWEDTWSVPSIFHDHARTSDPTRMSRAAGVPQMKVKMDSKKTLEFHREINHTNKRNPCLNFSAGCELHEALGPAFKKRKTEIVVQMPNDTTCNSNLTTVYSCAEHLLEAAVADACRKATNVKHENTVSGSVKSPLTADKVFEPPTNDTHTASSAGYSFHQYSVVEEKTLRYIPTSGAHDARYSKGFSSASYSKCNEQMERPRELYTISSKSARHGKRKRRPRDRLLIQNRIKELRELVPNGSKCSIDSLLERAIKHMLFMQCTTEQADKLDKCDESKLVDKEIRTCGSSGDKQGSSWAMELGNHLRTLPVIVQNIDTSGQMLIKMLCEDCSPFLEIMKTIRSLGLTILKGTTEVYDGKILLCYVVEGQNNRNMHRTDVLCSLLQTLQQKAYV